MELDRATVTNSPKPLTCSVTVADTVAPKIETIKASPTSSNAILTSGGNGATLLTGSTRPIKTNRGPKAKLVKIAPAPPIVTEMTSTSKSVTGSNNSSMSRIRMK